MPSVSVYAYAECIAMPPRYAIASGTNCNCNLYLGQTPGYWFPALLLRLLAQPLPPAQLHVIHTCVSAYDADILVGCCPLAMRSVVLT
eukprot:1542037-Rhodomonas_salina.1